MYRGSTCIGHQMKGLNELINSLCGGKAWKWRSTKIWRHLYRNLGIVTRGPPGCQCIGGLLVFAQDKYGTSIRMSFSHKFAKKTGRIAPVNEIKAVPLNICKWAGSENRRMRFEGIILSINMLNSDEIEQGHSYLLEILEGVINRRVNQHDWYATSPGEGEGLWKNWNLKK